MRSALFIKQVFLSVGRPETLVYMPAASGELLADLGHERGQDTVTVSDFLDAGFEQHGAVGGFQYIGVLHGRLIHAGTRFGMQSFERHAPLAHLVEQVLEIRTLLGRPQDRIAEHATAQRLKIPVMAFRQRRCILYKIEPFKFLRKKSLKPRV